MNDNLFLFAMLLLFVMVFGAIEGLYIWWNSTRGPEAMKLSKRLKMIADDGAGASTGSLLKRPVGGDSPVLARLMAYLPLSANVERLLVQSGTRWTLANYAVYTAGLFVFGLAGMSLAGFPPVPGLVAGAALGAGPSLYLAHCRYQRLKRFEVLLPEALDLIGRSLRAGHSLSGALQMAGAEMPDPVGEEFQQVFDEINFGISAQEALQNLAKRVPSTDLAFFVVALLIQRESGGNLSELLSNISAVIRERLKLFGKVRALSAEGRFSGLVLCILPFLTGFMLYMIDRDFMSLLWTDESGMFFIKGGLAFMAVGSLWMNRIVRIRV